jgi:chromosome segregation ATPase
LAVANYFELTSQRHLLLRDIERLRSDLSDAENEKEIMLKEISSLQSKLARAEMAIRELEISLALTKEEKGRLVQEASRLRYEKEYLKDYLRSKSRSLKELKKAIREIKREMSLAKKSMQRRIDIVQTMQGNRGYLVKDGESTFKRRKVRVIPIAEREGR